MKKKGINIITFIFLAIIVLLIIYNLICNKDSFLKVDASNCINLFMVLGISYFIAQVQNNRRKQKDIFIKLLESLRCLVDNEKSYNFINVDKEEVLMQLRNISTKVDIIKHYSNDFNIEKEAKFLEEKFNEYQSVIDNHIANMEFLSQLHNELKRPLKLMSEKVFEMMLKLYN